MLDSTELPGQAARAPLLQPEAGDLGYNVPGDSSRSGAALPCVLPGCLCSMEAAGRQSWAFCSAGSRTSETQSTTSRRNEPLGERQGLPTPDPACGGRRGCTPCHRQEKPCPAVPPSLLLPPLHCKVCHPPTREGTSCLAASGHWEQEGDSWAADDKNPSCGMDFELCLPQEKGETPRQHAEEHSVPRLPELARGKQNSPVKQSPGPAAGCCLLRTCLWGAKRHL